MGVHHIYTMADNPDDLSFVQGYITAKHRLFQMDFFRKVAEEGFPNCWAPRWTPVC